MKKIVMDRNDIERDLKYWLRYYFKTMRSLRERGYQAQVLGEMQRIGAILILMEGWRFITEEQRAAIYSIAVDFAYEG